MKLETYRRQRRFSYNDLARHIGVNHGSTVNRWCVGTRRPKADDMIAIYVATEGQVEPNDFFDLPPLAAE